ncbi:hypothetical protein JCM10207_001392 [Rhodosporidiobolus poonsookiae]
MLDQLPDIAQLVFEHLDCEDLEQLSLTSKAFLALVRPLLFRTLSLGWFRWPFDDEDDSGKAVVRYSIVRVLNDPVRLSLLKKLRILNHENWMDSEPVVALMVKLFDRVKLDELHIAQAERTIDMVPLTFNWSKLWVKITEHESLRVLRLQWHRGAFFGVEKLKNLEEVSLGPYNLGYVYQMPPRLRTLVLDNMDTGDDDYTFPSSVFETLEYLAILHSKRIFLRKLYAGFKAYFDNRFTPAPALHTLRLDLFQPKTAFSFGFLFPDIMGTQVHLRDIAKLLELFSAAPALTTLALASLPDLSDKPLPDFRTGRVVSYNEKGEETSRPPPVHYGVDGKVVDDTAVKDSVDELFRLVGGLAKWFPRLSRLTLYMPTDSPCYFALWELENISLLAQHLAGLVKLKHFKTNLLTSLADLGDELLKEDRFVTSILLTATKLVRAVPHLATLELTTCLFHPIQWWHEPHPLGGWLPAKYFKFEAAPPEGGGEGVGEGEAPMPKLVDAWVEEYVTGLPMKQQEI